MIETSLCYKERNKESVSMCDYNAGKMMFLPMYSGAFTSAEDLWSVYDIA